MLKKITIKGFQAHESTEIEFLPGVTVITGSSDTGKSSIVRSIRLIAFNRPTGSSYIRKGMGGCFVELVGSSPGSDNEQKFHTVARKKEKGFNGYIIDGQNYAAAGTSVPPEVGFALGIEDINLQSQHDTFFMLQDTPAEVARRFNEVAGLEIIDTTITNINSIIRKISQELFSARTTEGDLVKEEASLGWVDAAQELLALCEQEDREKTKTEKEKDSLHTLVVEGREALDDITGNMDFLSSVDETGIFRAQKVLASLEGTRTSLLSQLDEYREADGWASIDWIDQLGEFVSKAEQLNKEMKDLESEGEVLRSRTGQALASESDLKQKKLNLVAAEFNLKEAEKRMKICPTCKRPMEAK